VLTAWVDGAFIEAEGEDLDLLHHKLRPAAGAVVCGLGLCLWLVLLVFGAQRCRAWGSWCSVDGLGGGAFIEAEAEDLDFLRTTSFGLLQVRFLGAVGFGA
jgi:nitrate reductase NapE component